MIWKQSHIEQYLRDELGWQEWKFKPVSTIVKGNLQCEPNELLIGDLNYIGMEEYSSGGATDTDNLIDKPDSWTESEGLKSFVTNNSYDVLYNVDETPWGEMVGDRVVSNTNSTRLQDNPLSTLVDTGEGVGSYTPMVYSFYFKVHGSGYSFNFHYHTRQAGNRIVGSVAIYDETIEERWTDVWNEGWSWSYEGNGWFRLSLVAEIANNSTVRVNFRNAVPNFGVTLAGLSLYAGNELLPYFSDSATTYRPLVGNFTNVNGLNMGFQKRFIIAQNVNDDTGKARFVGQKAIRIY